MRPRLPLLASAVLLPLLAACWITQPLVLSRDLSPLPRVDENRLRQDVLHMSTALATRHSDDYRMLMRGMEFVRARMVEQGVVARVQTFEVEGKLHGNVVARFGPAAGRPLVIGAHYDVMVATPGADDNASGVAGLLELARLLAQNPPAIPVELVAYTLEEPPSFGSAHMGSRLHADALATQGTHPRLMIALEMIGYFDDRPGSQRYPVGLLHWLYPDRGNFIAVVGHLGGFRETRLVKSAMVSASTLRVRSINAPASLPGVDFSDHASYWRHGMPAVMVTDTAFYRNPNYHRPGDRAATLDYARMAQVVRGVYAVVKLMERNDVERETAP